MTLSLRNKRLLTLISLLLITSLGLLSKSYDGLFHQWLNYYSGDILYEIFWCLFFFLLIPSKKNVTKIPMWVFIVTCVIEILQLWQNPLWVEIRATLLGKLFLGTNFDWWDFTHYFLGCFIGWLWLIDTPQLKGVGILRS